MNSKPLAPKRAKFVDEYLVDLNGTQAAIRSGYAASGAATEARRLLANAQIQAIIAQKRADLSTNTGVTVQRVVQEAARLGFSDMREVAEWSHDHGVRFKASDELSDDAARSIMSVKSKTTRRTDEDENEFETVELEVKLYPKEPALTLLAKHLGMLKDPKADAMTAIAEAIRSARERAARR